jgi:regulatory protein YycI of two-component signal transduction system YycFG
MFIQKHQTSQLQVIEETSVEEKLKEDNITYPAMVKDAKKEPYVSAKTKNFSIDELDQLKNQKVKITNKTTVQGTLLKPLKIDGKVEVDHLNDFIKNDILYGDQFKYWDYDDKKQIVTYYQQFKNKVFYNNMNGQLIVHLNDQNEIVSYEETLLDSIVEINDQETTLTGIDAIETLHNKGMLKPDSHIEKVELGYYTIVQLTESQVLTPTWHFVVESGKIKEDLFVNAFEGQIIELDTEDHTTLE